MDIESVSSCRECLWYDPAYDQCHFRGTVRIDDIACENFEAEEFMLPSRSSEWM